MARRDKMHFQVPGLMGSKKKFEDINTARKASKDEIEVVLSVQEYKNLINKIDHLHHENERTKEEHRRNISNIKAGKDAEIALAKEREKGLRDALSRHPKKAGQEEKDKPFRETFDGSKHRIHVELPISEETSYQDAFEFAQAESRRNNLMKDYYLKEVVRSGSKWQGIYQR